MTRKPKIELPEIKKKDNSRIITQLREYKLITPLFGGGVKAGEVDEVTPIRGSVIRGHLRFWWRATRGGKCNGDLKRMKAVEDEIWGSTKSNSAVSIAVITQTKGEPFKDTHSPPFSYVTFPLREDKGTIQDKLSFKLTISFPQSMRNDVEASLWAWENFGGIGARTRRGLGALQCTKIDGKLVNPLDAGQLKQRIKEFLQDKNHVVSNGKWPKNVPHLSASTQFEITHDFQNKSGVQASILAWKHLIERFQSFRQYKKEKFGANLWPDANALRHTFRGTLDSYKGINKYPRSAFGLPINFELMHDSDLDNVILKPFDKESNKVLERFASPLIFRPIVCSRGAVGVALILNGSETPTELLLEGKYNKQDKSFRVQGNVELNEVTKIPPLSETNQASSKPVNVLRTFLKLLQE